MVANREDHREGEAAERLTQEEIRRVLPPKGPHEGSVTDLDRGLATRPTSRNILRDDQPRARPSQSLQEQTRTEKSLMTQLLTLYMYSNRLLTHL